MYHCPYCSQEVKPDPKNPGKYLCYNCKKRYDESKLVFEEEAEYDDPFGEYEDDEYSLEYDENQNSSKKSPTNKNPMMILAACIVLAILSFPIVTPFYMSLLFGICCVVFSLREILARKADAIKAKIPYIATLGVSCIGIIMCLFFAFNFVMMMLSPQDENIESKELSNKTAIENTINSNDQNEQDNYNMNAQYDNENLNNGIENNNSFNNNAINANQSDQTETNNFSNNNIDADSTSLNTFTLLGQTFTLCQSTLGDFERLNNAGADVLILSEDEICGAGDDASAIVYLPEENLSTMIFAQNMSDTPIKTSDCVVTMFRIGVSEGTLDYNGFSVCGLQIGMQESNILAKLGETSGNKTTIDSVDVLHYLIPAPEGYTGGVEFDCDTATGKIVDITMTYGPSLETQAL